MKDYITPQNLQIPSENIIFYSGKRKLVGWYIPSSKNSNATIILCHGWGASKGDILPSTIFLRDKFNLIYFDLTNHGESDGNKTSMGKFESEDIISAVDFLKKNKSPAASYIGVYGVSMGASAAIVAAAIDKRINAVVAESPFFSFNEIVSHYARTFLKVPRYPFVPLAVLFSRLRLGFDPEKYSPAFYSDKISPRPILIIASKGDINIPFYISEKVYKISKEPKHFEIFGDKVGHCESYLAEPQRYKRILENFFYETLVKTKN